MPRKRTIKSSAPVANNSQAETTVKRKLAKRAGGPGGGRKRFSDAERKNIIATAQRQGLTGDQVAKKFGISTVTYYLWRKKAGTNTHGRQGRRPTATAVVDWRDLTGQLREAVRTKVREMLPSIIEQEIGASFGRTRRRH